MRETIRLLKTKAMREIGVDIEDRRRVYPKCAQHEFLSDPYLECIIRHFATTVYHPTSTCKMGKIEDPTTVVDNQLRYLSSLVIKCYTCMIKRQLMYVKYYNIKR